MAAAFVTSASVAPGNGTGFNINITVSGANPVLILHVGLRKSSPDHNVTATWSLGGTLTLINAKLNTVDGLNAYSWSLALPAPAAGAGTLAVSLGPDACDYHGVAEVWSGADQTTPCPIADSLAVDTATNPITVTPANLATGDASTAICTSTFQSPTSAAPNSRYNAEAGADTLAVMVGDAADTTGVTFTGSGNTWRDNHAIVALRIVAAAGGGGGVGFPTFVAAGTLASGTGPITPALPAGIAFNDILLLALQTDLTLAPFDGLITIPTPAGGTWTQLSTNTSNTHRLTVFWSRYNGTQTAPTTSDSGDHQIGRIFAFRGCPTDASFLNADAGGGSTFTETASVIDAVTTTVANCLIVDITSGETNAATGNVFTNAGLANIIERSDDAVTVGAAAGLGGTLALATGEKAVPGSTGTTTATHASWREAHHKIALAPLDVTSLLGAFMMS